MDERPFNPWPSVIVATLLVVLTVWSMFRTPIVDRLDITGETMGTTYSLVLAEAPLKNSDIRKLKEAVNARLAELNRALSTYDPESEISILNKSKTGRQSVAASKDLRAVMAQAAVLSDRSKGAFEPSLSPLVELWGFGALGPKGEAPPDEAIQAALTNINFTSISLTDDGYFQKSKARTEVDLNAIAKGYAVDEISKLITAFGCSNALVEIGGEMRATGRPPERNWRIGIPLPALVAAEGLTAIVGLDQVAIATSGDYRNYFEDKGHRYSHILDPRTGYPLTNKVASVSVIAPNCMLADGLATTLMVLGPEDGVALIEQWPNVEALVISRLAPGVFTNRYSSGMSAFIVNTD